MTLPSRGLAGLVLSTLAPALCPADVPDGFQEQPVLADLVDPTGVAFLPDGRLLTWLQHGHVLICNPDAAAPIARPYLTLAGVDHYGERGLIDLTLDPDFALNGFLYVFYSHAPSGFHRVSRFTHQGAAADPASEVLIWRDDAPWSSCCHVGGGLDFGPDGYLYLSTGDEFSTNQAQDLGRAGGKILRFSRDGSIPPDNPFLATPGALPEVYARGLRNPFRARFDAASGRLFIAEVGSNDHQTAIEDIVLGAAGANYGWPFCEGACADPEYVDPIHSYPHGGLKACVVGGIVYRGQRFPHAWRGRYFYGDYSRGWIRALELDDAGQVTLDAPFAQGLEGLVALEQSPAGELYYVLHDASGPARGSVWRIDHPGGGPAPPRPAVPVPLAGRPPVAGIVSPLDGSTFRFGDVIEVAGFASDPDGDLDPASYVWHVEARLSEGNVPLLGPLSGPSFSFPIVERGLGAALRAHGYELRLQVTDADGLTAAQAVRIEPELVPLGFDSTPAGVPITVAGTLRHTPFRFFALASEPLPVAIARTHCLAGSEHEFLAWSSGAPREHAWTVPPASATLAAQLGAIGSPCGCNRSLWFDGYDDFVRLPALTLTGDFTLEAWVAPSAHDAFDGILGPLGLEDGLHLRHGRPAFAAGAFELAAPDPLALLAWTHVALRRAEGLLELIVDGVPAGGAPWAGALELDVLGAGWSGQLDDVAVWDRARGVAEILAQRYASPGPGDPGLRAAWNFDDALESQVVFDASGNGHLARLGLARSAGPEDPARGPSSLALEQRPPCPERELEIAAPRAASAYAAGVVDVRWRLRGHAADDQVIVQLDGADPVSHPATRSEATLRGVGPGSHRLALGLADRAGRAYAGVGAEASFVLVAPEAPADPGSPCTGSPCTGSPCTGSPCAD